MGFLLDLCCVAPPSLQEPKAVAELLGVRAVQHEPKSSRNGRITQVCVFADVCVGVGNSAVSVIVGHLRYSVVLHTTQWWTIFASFA